MGRSSKSHALNLCLMQLSSENTERGSTNIERGSTDRWRRIKMRGRPMFVGPPWTFAKYHREQTLPRGVLPQLFKPRNASIVSGLASFFEEQFVDFPALFPSPAAAAFPSCHHYYPPNIRLTYSSKTQKCIESRFLCRIRVTTPRIFVLRGYSRVSKTLQLRHRDTCKYAADLDSPPLAR